MWCFVVAFWVCGKRLADTTYDYGIWRDQASSAIWTPLFCRLLVGHWASHGSVPLGVIDASGS